MAITRTLDRLRGAADYGRRAIDRLGMRQCTVTIRIENWSAPIGTSGATALAPTDVVLIPNPKVREAAEGSPSWFAGGSLAAAVGMTNPTIFEVGPISQQYIGGGYLQTQLLPALTDTTHRVLLLLDDGGNEFASGGEVVRVLKCDATRPLRIMILAARTGQTG